MNRRIRKKRKKQREWEGLQRGNRYLAEVIGRLTAEKEALRQEVKGTERLYELFFMAAVRRWGGSLFLSTETAAELSEGWTLKIEGAEDGLWLKTVPRGEGETSASL
ncbi:MAG: hypothetical protein Q4C06_04780 [Bacillota bacterium]|nr:hypothetical protein [Bacillota bacterium]